jgi:DNA-damage-inducible protein D
MVRVGTGIEGKIMTGDTHNTGSVFESIRHTDGAGGEYWSARELGKVLGYTTNFRNFLPVIAKAESACEGSGHAVADHFAHVRTMIAAGKGAHRAVDDVHLSRYACYLVVMNGDPDKPIIAAGQTYFAVQTRRAELGDITERDPLAGLSEAERRLVLREQVAQGNTSLASTAYSAGVVSSRDFATFQNHGYRGLYAGETAKDIAVRKGLGTSGSGRILDHMGAEELAANFLRVTQAEAKIRREGISDKDTANQAHHDVGAAIRHLIVDELGGTPPEQLPTPAESIQQLQTRERKQLEGERQPSLFDDVGEN